MIKQYEIPDVRDGLTSLQRRMLWTMKTMRLTSKNHYAKAANVIRVAEEGEKELEKFFDFIYGDVMVPMTQTWRYPQPLIDGGYGNWGSPTGEYEPAAPRFTDCRLTAFAEKSLLTGLNQRTVKFVSNPNVPKGKEPSVLPARFPNALLSGTSGSSHIPPHNLGEVIDACIAMLKNPDLKPEQLLDYIKGPDFPTGGTIINKSDLPAIYQTGVGELRIRGVMDTETTSEGAKQITVKEIPYTMIGRVEEFIEYIQSEYMKEFFLPDIIGVEEIPGKRKEFKVHIILKKDADVKRNTELLYEYSDLEDNFDYRALLTSNGKPSLMSLHQILISWLDFYRETMTRQNRGVSPTEEDLVMELLKIKYQFAAPRKTKLIDVM